MYTIHFGHKKILLSTLLGNQCYFIVTLNLRLMEKISLNLPEYDDVLMQDIYNKNKITKIKPNENVPLYTVYI